jgi:hypothetical protein
VNAQTIRTTNPYREAGRAAGFRMFCYQDGDSFYTRAPNGDEFALPEATNFNEAWQELCEYEHIEVQR